MAEHRRPAIVFSDAPRGTCRWCGEEILYAAGPKRGELDRRRRWHPRCVKEYNATDPRELRRRVLKRDRGVCVACGLDTRALRREVRGRGQVAKLRELGFLPRRSLWELDHTVPLADGGTHAESNLQTLCAPCHRQKSAREARERAVRARASEPPAVAETAPEPQPRKRAAKAARPSSVEDWEALMARADVTNARVEQALGARGA